MKRKSTQPNEWLTLAEAAVIANVSERTIQYWDAEGCIKSKKYRQGRQWHRRYLKSSVAAFAAETVEE